MGVGGLRQPVSQQPPTHAVLPVPTTHLGRRQLLAQQLDLSRQLSLAAAVRGTRLDGTALASTVTAVDWG